jgi:hypothetical protein
VEEAVSGSWEDWELLDVTRDGLEDDMDMISTGFPTMET